MAVDSPVSAALNRDDEAGASQRAEIGVVGSIHEYEERYSHQPISYQL